MERQHKLECKFDFSPSEFNLEKGWTIELEGVMEQFFPGPPTLKVTDKTKIEIISEEKVPFAVVYFAFKTTVNA